MSDTPPGFADRHALLAHLDERLGNAEIERALGGFAVMLVGIDAVGSSAGLRNEVAARMTTTLRDTDFLALVDDDQFAVVIPQVSDRATAIRVADKLLIAFDSPIPFADPSHGDARINARIGISFFPADGTTREALLQRALEAMRTATASTKIVTAPATPA